MSDKTIAIIAVGLLLAALFLSFHSNAAEAETCQTNETWLIHMTRAMHLNSVSELCDKLDKDGKVSYEFRAVRACAMIERNDECPIEHAGNYRDVK